MAKIIILGGGYSGLACLSELSKKQPGHELHLIDARSEHFKITNLHKTLLDPLEKYRVPFAELAKKFNFHVHQQRLTFSEKDLRCWQDKKSLPLPDATLEFDFMVVSTGALPMAMPAEKGAIKQQELWRKGGGSILQSLPKKEPVTITVVGGGATGIQFLFELKQALRTKRLSNTLRLIDLNSQLVPELPRGVHDYIARKLQRSGIEYLAETRFLRQKDGSIDLEDLSTGRSYALPSDRVLLFPGVTPSPLTLQTNPFGQVESGGKLLANIFSAGDCSNFNSSGLNALTAQAAVRKGKLVARNIQNLLDGRRLQAYRYREKGYLVSLGPLDAVGWIGLRCNLVKGFPASVVKDAMETQYDLFLSGVDTYLDFL